MEDSLIDSEKPIESLIYHYTTIETAIEHILDDQQIRLSPLRLLNDPREAKDFSYSLLGTGLPPEGMDQKQFKASFKLNEAIKDHGKVICFSSDILDQNTSRIGPFLKGYAKSRMWSQYGQNHKGIILVFEKEKLIKSIESQNTGADQVFHNKVTYADYSPTAVHARTISGDLLSSGIDIEDYSYKHLQKHYNALFFEKNLDYKDETEFRIVILSKDRGYQYHEYRDSLAAVVVGVDFPGAYRRAIEELSVRSKASLRRVKWLNGKPYLSNSI